LFTPVASSRGKIRWLNLVVWLGAAAISILFWSLAVKALNIF
jgi:hypothetical protein